MRAAFRTALLLVLATLVVADVRQGIKPRSDMADYPVHAARDDVAVGAAVLPPEQVRNTFASDLNRGYVVIEVAIHPKAGRSVAVAADDFTLRIANTRMATRPASPRAIAAILQKDA